MRSVNQVYTSAVWYTMIGSRLRSPLPAVPDIHILLMPLGQASSFTSLDPISYLPTLDRIHDPEHSERMV